MKIEPSNRVKSIGSLRDIFLNRSRTSKVMKGTIVQDGLDISEGLAAEHVSHNWREDYARHRARNPIRGKNLCAYAAEHTQNREPVDAELVGLSADLLALHIYEGVRVVNLHKVIPPERLALAKAMAVYYREGVPYSLN